MFRSFAKAVDQLGDRRTRGVLWIGLAVALVVLVILWSAVGYLIVNTSFFSIGWLESVTDILGGLATLVLTWLLFPAVVSAVVGFFLETVAQAVESRHYPHLPKADGLSFGETLATTAKFLAVLILLNLVTLPFLFFPPVFPFVFYGINGYLLSREYFELVALRRLNPIEATALRKRHKGPLFLSGVVIAFLLTVPVVNLLAPVVATAAMVHLFESWRSTGQPAR